MHHASSPRYWLPLVLLAALLLPLTWGRVAAEPPSSTEAWYNMDREAWMHTDDERFVRTKFDLHNGPNLDEVPLKLGPWTGRDVPIANEATFPTLDADRIVYRMYQRSGLRTVIFSMIGATKGQSLHHPLICYQFAGWGIEDRGTTTVPVDDGEVVLRYVIGRDPRGPAQIDLHFFLWPTAGRGWDDGVTQVRITALSTVTDEIALADARSFATLLFAQARRLDEVALTPTPRPTALPIATPEPRDLVSPAVDAEDAPPARPIDAPPPRLPVEAPDSLPGLPQDHTGPPAGLPSTIPSPALPSERPDSSLDNTPEDADRLTPASDRTLANPEPEPAGSSTTPPGFFITPLPLPRPPYQLPSP